MQIEDLLYKKYHEHTMIPKDVFCANLRLSKKVGHLKGAVVECGVWKGGMITAISEILGGENDYYLFDSFMGLPPAREIDGEAALSWQSNPNSGWYYDNCRASYSDVTQTVSLSPFAGNGNYHIHAGWFEDSLISFSPPAPIILLRLDADWYSSTKLCLEVLFDRVCAGGIIIIDDYYMWDGCTRAVHEFIVQHGSVLRISQFENTVAFIVKH